MSESVEIVQHWLGLNPFVLITLKDLAEDGNFTMSLDFGGGVNQEDLPMIFLVAVEELTGVSSEEHYQKIQEATGDSDE